MLLIDQRVRAHENNVAFRAGYGDSPKVTPSPLPVSLNFVYLCFFVVKFCRNRNKYLRNSMSWSLFCDKLPICWYSTSVKWHSLHISNKICLIWLETPLLSGKLLKYPRAYQDIELLSTRVFQGSLGTLFFRKETPASIRCPTLIVTSIEFELKELRRLSLFITKYISFFRDLIYFGIHGGYDWTL